ncbi:MAG: HAD-IG family 5'-nucleotidase [Acidimicrobiia bacterium]|nr:HAD-IG family 5'-nucleotidase [Acidimicrobiia bacterium]
MSTDVPLHRRLFGNRTLNLRRIRAIGYDMDYTLVHYRMEEWERRAYHHTRRLLARRGWPVEGLEFDPSRVIRGLTIDLELGNLVKPTRFGYVIRAAHGTRFLEFEEQRAAYTRVVVDLGDPRFVFLNTLFTLSEATLYAQLVDLLDAGSLSGVMSYSDLYRVLRATVDEAHLPGTLKEEILADPGRFLEPDPETVVALLDQRHAGKRLMLITNSDWDYARRLMAIAFDSQLPEGMAWRDLFDLIIVGADKPGFFTESRPLYRIADENQGLMRPHHGDLEPGGVYFGGDASRVEEHLGLSGDEILYVGDHLYADVHVSKAVLRWRTALILRELELEIDEIEAFRPTEEALRSLMGEKEVLERRLAQARLDRQRARHGYAPPSAPVPDDAEAQIARLQEALVALDDRIAPLARAAGEVLNPWWGPLMRSGYDKSLFARQVERYADVYTSRVSNFLYETPYAFLRAARSTLPHDPC